MRRWWIAAIVLLVAPSAGHAEITIDQDSITPENRIVNKSASQDVIGDSGGISFIFSADVTGLVELFVVTPSGNRNSRKSIPYGSENVTTTIEISAEEIQTSNLSDFDIEVQLAHEASGSQTTETTESTSSEDAVTEVESLGGFLIDGQRPEPIQLQVDEVELSIADGAVNVHWNPSEEYSTSASEVSNNVEFFRVVWATQPLSGVVNIVEGDSLTQRGDLFFGQIANYEGVSFADAPGDDENYLIEGLENSVTVYVTVHPIDHAGNAGFIAVDSQGRALDVSEAPISTTQLAEILGIDDRCFVVTAAFGDARAGWVDAWRFFRDGFLLRLPFGEPLVAAYYAHGPKAANWLADTPWMRHAVKAVLMLGAPVAILLGGGGPLVLLLAGAWLLRRRRQHLVLLVLLMPQAGHAIEFIHPGLSLERSAEIQIGQMQPDRVQGSDPGSGLFVRYEDVYGPKGAFPFQLAYQLTPFQLLGDWGFRGSVGFGLDRGKAINTESGAIEKTPQTTKFLYIPSTVGMAYRGRWFENQPVLISGNVGFDFWGFSEKGGAGSPSTQNFVYGWHAAGALEIQMDWMERKAALQMREAYGIRDTMLFVGWQYTQLDDFGNLDTADFTHHDWIAGFRFVFE